MGWLTRFREWRKRRRVFKHEQWCRKNGVIFLKPRADERSSLQQFHRIVGDPK